MFYDASFSSPYLLFAVLDVCLAITTNGNSGGMIIDYNYNLVGVVTYGMTSSDGKYMYGAGSPISKVKEFLTRVGDYYD